MRYYFWVAAFRAWQAASNMLGKASSFAEDRASAARSNAHYYAPQRVRQQRQAAALRWLENRKHETRHPAD